MVLVTRQAMLDDGGLFTTGTVIDEDFIDAIYDEIDDQCHSNTSATTQGLQPKDIIDEVVEARGSMASLDERLSVSLAANGDLSVTFANISGGLRVGFAGTTSADRIDLGDADLYWDLAAGGAGKPGFFFDATDYLEYERATDIFSFYIASTQKLALSSTKAAFQVLVEGPVGSVGAPGITFRGNNTIGLYITFSGLSFAVGGTERGGFAAVGQFHSYKGADVASAATIEITGNLMHVTGTTTITSVSGTAGGRAVKAGTRITLIFDDVLTFTDGSNLVLAGNFVTTADDTITLVYDGTNWYEICRSVN